MHPVSYLDFWPLQTLCCSPPVSLEVWCSLSQCHASSGASAAAAEPAPTQVQDLAETTHTMLITLQSTLHKHGRWNGIVSYENNCNQGPVRGKHLPFWSVLKQGNESLTATAELSWSWPWPLDSLWRTSSASKDLKEKKKIQQTANNIWEKWDMCTFNDELEVTACT